MTISRPFWLGRHEVTQAQWQAVIGSNPYTRDRSNPYYDLPGMAERITRPNHPATVAWNDAQEFIARLNEREGGARYRLPTEAEWEYGARAGTTTRYSFGDDDADLERHAWFGGDFVTGGHHPVGGKAPNPRGLYDVHGNVWEWVQDWYDRDYYAVALGARRPRLRGPALTSSWPDPRSAWRLKTQPAASAASPANTPHPAASPPS